MSELTELHPSFYFTTHAEPAVLVSKYTGDLADLLDDSGQCADVRVAKKNRSPRVKLLEYFLDQPDEKTHLPNTHVCRMWVFNMGFTVGLDDIRDRTETLQRKLSRFSSELKKEWGIEFLFRSTEFAPTTNDVTKKLFRDSQGNALKALPKLRRYLDDIEIYVKDGNYSKASGLVDCVMEQSNLIACCLLDDSGQCADVRNALLEVDRKTCGVPQSAINYSRQLYSVYNRSKTVQNGKEDQKQLTLATHDPPDTDPF